MEAVMFGFFTALVAENFWMIGLDQKVPLNALAGKGKSSNQY